MKVVISWDIGLCSLYVNRRFGGTYHLHLQGLKLAYQETSVKQEVHIRATRRHIPVDGIILKKLGLQHFCFVLF
jgi:hypothetical protein